MSTGWAAALFSAGHVLAFGLGLWGIGARRAALYRGDVPAVLSADLMWGIAALLWLVTGLGRAFGGLEKGTDWYLANHWFYAKMTLFVAVLILEAWPMVTFIRWRAALGRGAAPDLTQTLTLARISTAELVLVVLIPFFAATMARGLSL